jgi:hypothetical protein
VKILKRHLTVANVLSLTALFVALAGSAYAATKLGPGQVKEVNIANGAVSGPKLRNLAVSNPKLGKESVTEGKIKKLSVTNPKLGKESVTNGKIKKEAVTNAKLGKEAVTETKLKKEAVGRTKIGYEAVDSSKISAGLYGQLTRNVSYVNSATIENSEQTKSGTATCPSGKEAISGGVRLSGELANVAITGSNPFSSGSSRTGWSGFAHETGAGPYGDWSLIVFAVCAEL